ncbi:MAG: holo-[acyl-carrier-protein] synthase, partial [Oscillospiraceae bacterium]
AVFKCFGQVPGNIRLNEIEILSQPCGKPTVRLLGSCAQHAATLGIETIHLSLSYDGDYAIAYAVAEGTP